MKDKLMKIFRAHRNEFLSGEGLSVELGVSRNLVWKTIKALEGMGYEFKSRHKMGYMLVKTPDIPYAGELRPFLNSRICDIAIIYKTELDSTNNYAKRLALNDLESQAVVIAKQQSGGRGKLGTKWESSGELYLSAILRPEIDMFGVIKATENIISRIAGSIEESFSVKTEIEDYNILIDGKKCCGVLIEFSGEVDRIEYMVVGIGVEISEITAMGYKGKSLVEITAGIVNALYQNYDRKS